MNRYRMIAHIGKTYTSWGHLVASVSSRDKRELNGWKLSTDDRSRFYLGRRGSLRIYPFNCKFGSTATNYPNSQKDNKGRYSCKHTDSFKRSVAHAKKTNKPNKGPRMDALAAGEEYYMLDTPCRKCGEIHERHVFLSCDRLESKAKNDDIDMPNLNKASLDFISSLTVKHDKPEKVIKTSNEFFADFKCFVNSEEYSEISAEAKKALINLAIGDLS